jgi:hypothetical protein
LPENKTLKALAAVVAALAPLDPEARRRALEATHALLEISPGRRGEDAPARGPRRGKRR